jgi:hypothetical protein
MKLDINDVQEITHMNSSEGEKVAIKAFKIKGSVETWLDSV